MSQKLELSHSMQQLLQGLSMIGPSCIVEGFAVVAVLRHSAFAKVSGLLMHRHRYIDNIAASASAQVSAIRGMVQNLVHTRCG